MADEQNTPADSAVATVAAPRRVWLFVLVAVLAFTADLVSKLIVVAELPYAPVPHPPVRILWGAIYLDQVRNSGAAFSLGAGFTVILTAVAVAVVVVIVRTASRMRSAGWAVALGLVLGGAIGNLGDRVFRAPSAFSGHVVDWISVFGPLGKHWPIFNLADSAIVCGAILAGIQTIRGIELNGSMARHG
ncbi:signal peptidase II [Jatrophihabitans sp.]|uniref:signal peptidase II n=1 Tax=Jatrophihabitans sp. TaxID=1932789 RepID=UPI0030C66FCB|nr:lipoprotein signal peptidase [Jatrophihabitans sp.]